MRVNRGADLCTSSLNDTKNIDYNIAILPWGAIEPHNQHLPYLTDSILAHAVSVDAVVVANIRGAKAIVLPPVDFGSQNPGQRELPFCIHTKYATQYAILCDIVDSLSAQGINRMLIVNGHGGNNFRNMIRDLSVDKPDFIIATTEWYTVVKDTEYFEEPGNHAGDLESSVMLHYHEELVDMSTAGDGAYKPFANKSLRSGKIWSPRNWLKISVDTGIGDPRPATKEKGTKYVEAVVAELSEIIVDFASGELY
ncbi:MAG: creatininase family protein [Rikenellaceae bacterium]